MRWRTHLVLLGASIAVTLPPRSAAATGMDGLVLVVAGTVVAVPAAVLLVIAIVTSVALRSATRAAWHGTFARVVGFGAPVLGVAFPLATLALDGDGFLGIALVLDVPLIALAVAAMLLARRLRARAV